MQLLYLDTAEPGLRWFRQYYAQRPELNWHAALESLQTVTTTLKAHPYSGHSFDGFPDVLEKPLPRTQFSLLYTVRDNTIFVIDLRDQRGWRSAAALRSFVSELRRRYGLDDIDE